MVLMIDNYDSFTYNVVQYLAELGHEVAVFRNDEITVERAEALAPRAIVISPGPGAPESAGISLPLIARLAGRFRILGICLGHQAIGHAFGGKVVRAARVMHGKVSRVRHDGEGVFRGLPAEFSAARYHSLAVARDSMPACLKITAEADDGEIMGLRHREFAVEGVQFHPEALLTEHGHKMLQNFIEGAKP